MNIEARPKAQMLSGKVRSECGNALSDCTKAEGFLSDCISILPFLAEASKEKIPKYEI
jgi:hypothetical protein